MRLLISLAIAAVAALAANPTASAAALDNNVKLYGINYDRRQAPDWDPTQCKTQQQVAEDMKAIAQIAQSVRIYGLSDRPACHTSHVLTAAKANGIKVALGMWTGLTAQSFAEELKRLEGLLKTNAIDDNVVSSMHVGSEALLRKEYSAAVAVDYLNQVRAMLKKYNKSNLKLTIADVTNSYYKNPQLLKAVDYVSVNVFSFWEKKNVNEGVAVLLDGIRSLRMQAAALGKDVVIGETGWASGGSHERAGVATLANQKKFFQDFVKQATVHQLPYYWFVAFDALWQQQAMEPTTVEAHFGVMNMDRSLKSSYTGVDLKPRKVTTFQASGNGRLLSEAVNATNVMAVTGIDLKTATDLAATKMTKLQNQWIVETSTGGQVLRSVNSDRCLHATSGTNGAVVTTATCVDGDVHQKWAFDFTKKKLTQAGYSGYCLDYVPSSSANYKLQLWKCLDSSKNQGWVVTGLADDAFSAGTVAPRTDKPTPTATPTATASGGGESATSVRFFTKDSTGATQPFAQLVRVAQTVTFGFSAVGAGIAGSEWLYDETSQLLKSKDSTYCLDAYEPKNGGIVHVWTCNQQENNQKWAHDSATGQLKHAVHKGFCLDGDLARGVVHLWTCMANNNNQVWRKVAASSTAVRITNTKDASVVEFVTQDQQLGKPVVSPSNDKQMWFWNAVRGTLVSKWSGECLDAYEPKENGRVHTWSCSASEGNQKWAVDNGQIKHATHKGFCLAYASGSSPATKQLVLKSCNKSDATQLFALVGIKV